MLLLLMLPLLGFNLNMLLIFVAFSAVKVTSMPNWFGNNADSVEVRPELAFSP